VAERVAGNGRTVIDRRPAACYSDLGLFRHLKGIIDLDAEVSDRTVLSSLV
jgi:hypothetical protein